RFADAWDGPPAPAARLADVVEHIEHVRAVAGIEHVGLGGDFDGTSELPIGLDDVGCYPRLFDALLARSWSVADCERLAQRNVLRVLRDVDDAGP
ncbi:MAG: rane dipeptidase, partial [Pseudonocardiales bacterium]|nr:rane dipeptidase [Pseudonocardiales bacterium]